MTYVFITIFAHFSYLIDRGVCYLVLTEKSFPKKMAFLYLEDLLAEFNSQYGNKVETVSRPYSFIEFGNFFTTYTLPIVVSCKFGMPSGWVFVCLIVLFSHKSELSAVVGNLYDLLSNST